MNDKEFEDGLKQGAYDLAKNLQKRIYHFHTHPECYPPQFTVKKCWLKHSMLSGYSDSDYECPPPDGWIYSFNGRWITVAKDGLDALVEMELRHQRAYDEWATTYWPDGVPEQYQKYRNLRNLHED